MSELNDREKKIAQLADLAYKKTPGRKGMIRDIDLNLKLVPELSNKHIAVARDITNNDYYISHRGTKLDDFSDLHADLSIITGKESQNRRFKEAEKHLDRVKHHQSQQAGHKRSKKKGGSNLVVTGHSLGAAVGKHLADRNEDIEAHAFNPGSGIGAVRDLKEGKHKSRKNVKTYVTDGWDPISHLSRFGDDELVIVKQTEKSAHSLKNFL